MQGKYTGSPDWEKKKKKKTLKANNFHFLISEVIFLNNLKSNPDTQLL